MVRRNEPSANFVQTREQQIVNVAGTDSIGAGIRALVDGIWAYGFRDDEYFFLKIRAAFPELPDEPIFNTTAKSRSVDCSEIPSFGPLPARLMPARQCY